MGTDKAAYPINAMGMTKALMEKVMIALSRNLDPNKTIFCGTRYGNVMASRGSVIPIFVDQIKSGKSLTITNPNMTRFMRTSFFCFRKLHTRRFICAKITCSYY